MTANVKRQIARMFGEFLREAGVLVGVLAPLEWLVTHGTLTINAIAAIVVVAVPCLLLGHGVGIGALMFPLFLVPITIMAVLAAIVGFYCKLTARD